MERVGDVLRARCELALLFALLVAHGPVASYGVGGHPASLWPLPKQVAWGDDQLMLNHSFAFVSSLDSGVLSSAFTRYSSLIFLEHVSKPFDFKSNMHSFIGFLNELRVEIATADETLNLGTVESYKLLVPDPDHPSSALLTADTVYGALRGLETFSQLVSFNFEVRSFQIAGAPCRIADEPRFPFRGLLIDTSRHYEPLEAIRKVVDSMTYSKLNVLHWHIVDHESFPIETPSFPLIWKGAYSKKERFTVQDVKEIVEYARLRGVNVLPELDTPGHARSWGVGYPQLWPSSECTEPLDVSKNFTFELIDGVLSDFAQIFPFELAHLGGDEVNTSCWAETPHVSQWLYEHNLTTSDAYAKFVLRVQEIAVSHGFTPVNWEETFNNFGERLYNRTVVHNWLGKGVAPKIVAAGFQTIVSNQDSWYLDHLEVGWEEFYTNEPLAGIEDTHQQQLVLGGEICMWGETVDASNLLQTVWPRAAAAAERLWSPLDVTAQGPEAAVQRLHHFRCLLNSRGVPAAPVLLAGRAAPERFGSCYLA